MAILGVDIGGTNLRIGAVQPDGTVSKFIKEPTRSILRSADVLGDLAQALRDFAEEFPIEAVAIGFPATLDSERSRVVQAPSVPFMEALPARDGLREALGVPVFAERDVNFALLYDMEKYAIPSKGLVCGIYYGTGIGNAIAVDGRPLVGRHGCAGELGHIPVPGCELPCGCGNIGCLETLAGGKALARLQAEQYPQTHIGEIFTRHGQEEALLRFVDAMAVAAATEINILDPDMLLLGGGVLNMPDFPKERLMERILARCRKPFPAEDLPLIFTEDEPDKSVVGGAIYARKKLQEE